MLVAAGLWDTSGVGCEGVRASDADDISPDELVIEVDGEDVHVHNLDATSVLGLTVAYLDLLMRCAADRDEEIVFSGLRAFEKCGSIGTTPSDPELARQAVLDATKLLTLPIKPAHGLKVAVDRVREALGRLPSHYRTTVKVRGLERAIADGPGALAERPWATATLRARVQRVGGAAPRATFTSKSEARTFHLDLKDKDQATALGKHLYSTVDIVARMARDSSGYIEDGTLLEFYPVAGPNAQAAWTVWRDWFKHSGVRSLDELGENRTEDEDEGDHGDRQ
jgi:hypothetical protein